MGRTVKVLSLSVGAALAFGSVVAMPTTASADGKFETLGQHVSREKRLGRSAEWDPATGISRKAWASALADETVKVDENGRAFVVEPALTRAEIDALPESAAPLHSDISTAAAFTLHSNPSSTHVIYLDFTGHVVSGTAWNEMGTFEDPYEVPSNEVFPAFNVEGQPDTFSTAERQIIIDTWSAVVEDYSMFDVDVTTEEPTAGEINRTNSADDTYGVRAVITDEENSLATWCGCGGIAYVGTYNFYQGMPYDGVPDISPSSYYSPAFAFTRLGFNGKTISDIVSHEVGHNLGLSHDGEGADEYYFGRDGWAPIMGAGYNQPLVQWSNGDYTSSTNTEDDLATIQATGLPLLADDVGNSTGSATTVTLNDEETGVIQSRTDSDFFRFVPETESIDVIVTLPSVSPNLDVTLSMLDSGGSVIATANPNFTAITANSSSGLSASMTVAVTPGETYYVKIDGSGFGSGTTTGYSDYGSVGEYRLFVSGEGLEVISPTAIPTISGRARVGRRLAVNVGTWMDGTTLTYRWLRNGSNIRRATGTSYKLTSADRGRRISVRVTATKAGYVTVSETSARTARVRG